MRKLLFNTLPLVCICSCIFLSCKKSGNPAPVTNGKSKETKLISYKIEGMDAQVTFVPSDHEIHVRFPDSLNSGANIAASFTISNGATASVNGLAQVSGISKQDYEDNVNFLVTAEDGVTQQYWRVVGTNTDYSLPWGLGHIVRKAVSNNRDYDWYMGQSTTGAFNTVNCGPTSVTMAIKWYDSTFTKTPSDARNAINTGNVLWYSASIMNYLRDNNVPYKEINLADTAQTDAGFLKKELDKGHILILGIYTNFLRYSVGDTQRADRYYDWGNGHYIVVKGYKDVDNDTFFEVYDPWDYQSYPDGGGPKGKGRYYHATDLTHAAWYNTGSFFSIPPK